MSEIKIERLYNSPVDSNCFIIIGAGKSCIIVDPSFADNNTILSYLTSHDLTPDLIILTHEHFDHISSVECIRTSYKCKVVSTRLCSAYIQNPKKNLSIFYDQVGFFCREADLLIEKNEQELSWNGCNLKFLITPGHTEGSLCFSIGNNLFTGDTMIKDLKTIVKLPGGNKMKLKDSITMLADYYMGNTTVFPGHGDIFSLADYIFLND